jgi:hypothetical protein
MESLIVMADSIIPNIDIYEVMKLTQNASAFPKSTTKEDACRWFGYAGNNRVASLVLQSFMAYGLLDETRKSVTRTELLEQLVCEPLGTAAYVAASRPERFRASWTSILNSGEVTVSSADAKDEPFIQASRLLKFLVQDQWDLSALRAALDFEFNVEFFKSFKGDSPNEQGLNHRKRESEFIEEFGISVLYLGEASPTMPLGIFTRLTCEEFCFFPTEHFEGGWHFVFRNLLLRKHFLRVTEKLFDSIELIRSKVNGQEQERTK